MAKPWDQQEGEPDASYNRFLAYLGLGPARSIRKASCVFLRKPMTKKNMKWQPGSWTHDSRRWHWVERVRAYDRTMVENMGRDTCISFFRGMHLIALRGVEELERTKPRGWKQAVEALVLVSNYIPPEAAASIALPLAPGEPEPNVVPPE